jgi:chemotaxis protein MotB
MTLNRQDLQKLKEKLEQVLKQIPVLQHMEQQVKITLTTEGLRIDLIETEHGLFFESGNPKPSEAGIELLKTLAVELDKLPNKVAIEGHTDSRPYGRSDYSNWELSADRANAARRVLEENGLTQGRISQVRGFADQRLLNKDDPESASNRRISIIVRNAGLDEQEAAQASTPAAKPDAPPASEPAAAAKPGQAAAPAASSAPASAPASAAKPNPAPSATPAPAATAAAKPSPAAVSPPAAAPVPAAAAKH